MGAAVVERVEGRRVWRDTSPAGGEEQQQGGPRAGLGKPGLRPNACCQTSWALSVLEEIEGPEHDTKLLAGLARYVAAAVAAAAATAAAAGAAVAAVAAIAAFVAVATVAGAAAAFVASAGSTARIAAVAAVPPSPPHPSPLRPPQPPSLPQ